ncbi:IS256 family transposase [Microbacterium sp.]|uniref:IS256 family transposase n=1 Tax=Microbacterium sp. TaxID=51671 RepID=UPI002734FD58|nr:IS256 family transposase [Microbacterium sp.]MDP3949580.1 IS256 family transposase [Microbacterium sp.]
MEEVLDTVEVGRPRREPEEPQFLDAEAAEALIAQAREQGVELLGEGGLLKQMTKAVLERALAEELTDHLGYEVGDPAGNGSGNSRNGYTPKKLITEAGTLDLEVPRDRAGTHEPQIVRKGQSRLDGIDKIVIGLYAHGMTVRDIQNHLLDIYEIEVSPDLISKITDAVLDEVREWQARPLEPVWPVIFLDAIVCKVRDAGTVKNKAAHLAVGVGIDGKKEVLGIWVEHTEGAKFWLRVMNDLKARGIEDVLIVVCDGLTGLPAAIEAVWPDAVVQTCIVHLTRASLRWVNYKDRKRVAAQLRLIYSAPTEQAARDALDAWTDSEVGRQYPAIKRQWEAAWEQVIPFFAFPPEVRKVIYTTNMIESINYQLRKITKTRGHFPTDDALIKLLYLGCREMGRTTRAGRGGRSNYNWKIALNQFDVMFPGRLDNA